MANITPPGKDNFVDKEGDLTLFTFNWVQLVSQLDPITGTGTPEGFKEARVARLYVDTAGGAGSVLYVKTVNAILGDRTKGWILV